MASQGDKTAAKDEGDQKSTPSNAEVAPPLLSNVKGSERFLLSIVYFFAYLLKYFSNILS